jgi:hypothetical protein
MAEDFRIELTHSTDRLLPWTWAIYDPRNVEGTMHNGGSCFDSPGGALSAARDYMQVRAADRFIRHLTAGNHADE